MESATRVLAIVTAFREPPIDTVESLAKQQAITPKIVVVAAFASALKGLPSDVYCILHPPGNGRWTGVRVAKALNAALLKFNLNDYDYILKADDDAIFPKEFLLKNIEANFDLMGRGCGLLIRVKPFTTLMAGKFTAICSDDTYLVTCFSINNQKILPWTWVSSAIIKKQPSYNWLRMFEIGKDHYRMGNLSFSFSLSILRAICERGGLYVFILLGYFAALIKKEARYAIAEDVAIRDRHLFSKGVLNFLKLH